MKVEGVAQRPIRLHHDGWSVDVIDQTRLPFAFEVRHLRTTTDVAEAISNMVVRGAPLIGVTAAYGVALGMREDATDAVKRLLRDDDQMVVWRLTGAEIVSALWRRRRADEIDDPRLNRHIQCCGRFIQDQQRGL